MVSIDISPSTSIARSTFTLPNCHTVVLLCISLGKKCYLEGGVGGAGQKGDRFGYKRNLTSWIYVIFCPYFLIIFVVSFLSFFFILFPFCLFLSLFFFFFLFYVPWWHSGNCGGSFYLSFWKIEYGFSHYKAVCHFERLKLSRSLLGGLEILFGYFFWENTKLRVAMMGGAYSESF